MWRRRSPKGGCRYVARGGGRRRGESHDRFAVGESDSLCPVAVERRKAGVVLSARGAARPYQRGFEGAAGQCRHRQVRRDASAEKTVGSVHMPLPTAFLFGPDFDPSGERSVRPRFAPDSGFRFCGSPSCLLQDGIHRENRKTALRSAAFLFVSMRVAYLITTTRLFSMLPLKG